MKAVSRDGNPLPWYTYPAIDFLKYRTYEGRDVLEFGGGQSTLWWAQKARQVVTLEGDPEWYEKIKHTMPGNVDLRLVSMRDADTNVAQVREVLAAKPLRQYDVVIIDGLYRYEMIAVACDVLATHGVIVVDNAAGYGFHEGFKERGFNRVDFYGNCPGVVLPHCTSLYYRISSFVFDSVTPIHVIAAE